MCTLFGGILGHYKNWPNDHNRDGGYRCRICTDTSALSASPRRLTNRVLEVEGPTSADAGVASCLLVHAEPVFRRLRDDLLDGKIFDGMIRLGGFELQKRLRGSAL